MRGSVWRNLAAAPADEARTVTVSSLNPDTSQVSLRLTGIKASTSCRKLRMRCAAGSNPAASS